MPRNKSRLKRRRLSMTPLIDIIFLLLLFFMLSSTFTRFAEIPLAQGGSGATTPAEPGEVQTFFMRLTADGLTVNGQPTEAEELVAYLAGEMEDDSAQALLSLGPEVESQAFVETLALAQSVPGLDVTVLR